MSWISMKCNWSVIRSNRAIDHFGVHDAILQVGQMPCLEPKIGATPAKLGLEFGVPLDVRGHVFVFFEALDSKLIKKTRIVVKGNAQFLFLLHPP